jgi:hypothetical protein
MKFYIEDNQSLPAVQFLEDSDPSPTGFTITTDLEEYYNYGISATTDFLQLRRYMLEIVNSKTWTGLSSVEKHRAIHCYLKETSKTRDESQTEKITFLLSEGDTMEEAINKLTDAFAKFQVANIQSSVQRANSTALYKLIATYLLIQDATDFYKKASSLFLDYKNEGIRGIAYGDEGEGLLDYIESTVGTSFENNGLEEEAYTLKTGSYNDFIVGLQDVLIKGKY